MINKRNTIFRAGPEMITFLESNIRLFYKTEWWEKLVASYEKSLDKNKNKHCILKVSFPDLREIENAGVILIKETKNALRKSEAEDYFQMIFRSNNFDPQHDLLFFAGEIDVQMDILQRVQMAQVFAGEVAVIKHLQEQEQGLVPKEQ